MADKAWKQEERNVARLVGGTRYPANQGGRVDVEGPSTIAQVKHVQRLSLAQLEALAVEMAALGATRGKTGVSGTACPHNQKHPTVPMPCSTTWRVVVPSYTGVLNSTMTTSP